MSTEATLFQSEPVDPDEPRVRSTDWIKTCPIADLLPRFLMSREEHQALLERLADAESQRDALMRSRSTVRPTDPATSEAGAERVRRREGNPAKFGRGTQKHRLLIAYAAAADTGRPGLHDHGAAISARLDQPGTCWWKRSGELRQVGYIETTGQTARDNTTGSERDVCRITEAGRRYLRLLSV